MKDQLTNNDAQKKPRAPGRPRKTAETTVNPALERHRPYRARNPSETLEEYLLAISLPPNLQNLSQLERSSRNRSKPERYINAEPDLFEKDFPYTETSEGQTPAKPEESTVDLRSSSSSLSILSAVSQQQLNLQKTVKQPASVDDDNDTIAQTSNTTVEDEGPLFLNAIKNSKTVSKQSGSSFRKKLENLGFSSQDISKLSSNTIMETLLINAPKLAVIGFTKQHYKTIFEYTITAERFVLATDALIAHHSYLSNLGINNVNQYLALMKHENADLAITALVQERNNLQKLGITDPNDLIAITQPRHAYLSIRALIDNAKKLKQLGIDHPKQLVKIVSFDHGDRNIFSLCAHGAELNNKLALENDVSELVNMAGCVGGAAALQELYDNIDFLKSNLNITNTSDLVNITKTPGAAFTIKALVLNGEILMRRLHFTTAELVQMATVSKGAGSTIHYIGTYIDKLQKKNILKEQILGLYRFNQANQCQTTAAEREKSLSELTLVKRKVSYYTKRKNLSDSQTADTKSSRIKVEPTTQIMTGAKFFRLAEDNTADSMKLDEESSLQNGKKS